MFDAHLVLTGFATIKPFNLGILCTCHGFWDRMNRVSLGRKHLILTCLPKNTHPPPNKIKKEQGNSKNNQSKKKKITRVSNAQWKWSLYYLVIQPRKNGFRCFHYNLFGNTSISGFVDGVLALVLLGTYTLDLEGS